MPNNNKSRSILFADLSHTASGYNAPTFPLGVSLVYSYAKSIFKDKYNYNLFRFPEPLIEKITKSSFDILALSNYSWNFELGYSIAKYAHNINKEATIIFGGPNFPTNAKEKEDYLKKYDLIDFYIELEGELAFINLINQLEKTNFDNKLLKLKQKPIENTNYLFQGDIISGPISRINDINEVPSPYLNGILDEFFDYELEPIIETTRGCPFSCSFCADGIEIKNKIKRIDSSRVEEEIKYIAKKASNKNKISKLLISDLNFGMYNDDVLTAKVIAKQQQKYSWPVSIGASAGKNVPARLLNVAKELKGSWNFGSAIQSSDQEVLNNVNRKNIKLDAYQALLEYSKSIGNLTYTEIILGLPGDTKGKHFNSLKYGINNGTNQLRMYQAIMLYGTKMATLVSRDHFQIKTKFRVIPGSIGRYDFNGKKEAVFEIEEVIVQTKDLVFDDYVQCRTMNLLIETIFNGSIFEEVFNVLKNSGIDQFQVIEFIFNKQHKYKKSIKKIIEKFVFLTKIDLYDSHQEAINYLRQDEIIDKHLNHELGVNEILECKTDLILLFDDINDLVFTSVVEMLDQRKLASEEINKFMYELKMFTSFLKKDFFIKDKNTTKSSFNYNYIKLSENKFNININDINQFKEKTNINFYQTKWQQDHLDRELNLFDKSHHGLGKFLTKSNLDKVYRKCSII